MLIFLVIDIAIGYNQVYGQTLSDNHHYSEPNMSYFLYMYFYSKYLISTLCPYLLFIFLEYILSDGEQIQTMHVSV